MKKLPPISELSVLALAIVVAGGVFLAAHLPKHTTLVPTTVAVVLAGAIVLVNLFLLRQIKEFDWKVFTTVAKWTLLAYGLIAGALEYIFIKDGSRGSVLAVMTATLIIFAINLPIHFGFTVARYSDKTS
jgi:energy-coupling factor transporter transmembrane protein EcfT